MDIESIGRVPPQSIESEKLVLGCLMLQPEKDMQEDILDALTADDFFRKDHREIYEAIVCLAATSKPIEVIAVSEQLNEQGALDKVGGLEYLAAITNSVQSIYSAGYYAEIVKGMSTLRRLIKVSSNILNACYDNRPDVERIVQEAEKEILAANEPKKADNMVHASDALLSAVTELETRCKNKGSLPGVPTGFADLDYKMGGLQKQDLVIIAGRPSMGKEQPLYSKILTPDGWSTMGDMKVGSVVYGSNGNTCTATGVYPQGEKDIYRIFFSDETYTDCGAEHLWETKTRKERKNKKPASIKTTVEILNTLKVGSDNRYNHSVKYIKPIEFPQKRLPIHPYVLGALLGDGNLCDHTIRLSNPEPDVCLKFSQLLPVGDVLSFGKNGMDHHVKRLTRSNAKSDTKEIIDRLGLSGIHSPEKVIPGMYLLSSVEDRLNLLQGLLDTDGYVVGGNSIEYVTTSQYLATDIIELVRSLGGRITYDLKHGTYKKGNTKHNAKDYYRMNISFNSDIIPVSSNKHLLRYHKSKRPFDKFITRIDYIGKCQAQCIMVDSPDHLYVTDDYILTHNTALAENIARYVSSIKQLPVAFFSMEMSKERIMYREISSMAMINNNKLKLGTLDDEDWSKMSNIYGVIAGGKLEIDDTPHLKISEIRSKCRRLKNKYGSLGLIVIDHLTELWRPMRGDDVGEYSENVRGAKRIAKEMDCTVILLQQLSRKVEARNDKRPILSDLRETGVSEEVADVVLMLYRDDYYNPTTDKKNIAEVNIAKGRDIGTGIVELRWFPEYTMFANLANEFKGEKKKDGNAKGTTYKQTTIDDNRGDAWEPPNSTWKPQK